MISVIIPTCDRPGPLHRALRSVSRQTYRDFEVIVVRDGGASVDRVVTRWQTELAITLLDTGRPRGVSYARNLALTHGRGENIAFLDDDDVFLPHHLAEAAAVLDSGQAEAVYGQALVSPTWIEALPRSSNGLPRKDYPFDPAFLSVANTIHTGSLVIRNPAFARVRFDESLTHCEDWDFLLALHHTAGYRFSRLNTVTCVYHQLPRPGAVATAYRSSPTPFTRARATIYRRWPAPDAHVKTYRGWFQEFDRRLDTHVALGLPIAPHLFEHAVRGLHTTFRTGHAPDPSLLDRLLPPRTHPDRTSPSPLPVPTHNGGVHGC